MNDLFMLVIKGYYKGRSVNDVFHFNIGFILDKKLYHFEVAVLACPMKGGFLKLI